MERFRMVIAVVGEEAGEIILSFQSTIVAEDFPEGAAFSGEELRKILGTALGKYKRRLKEKRGEEFAEKEYERMMETVGEDCCKIQTDREYIVKESRMMLCFCELPFARKILGGEERPGC